MNIFLASDTHFNHAKAAEQRGFTSAEEHDARIIANWNSVVKPGDIVWHLGDVGLGSARATLEKVAQLNGRKQLVAGNHDQVWPGHRDARKHQETWLGWFESIQAYAKIRVGDCTLLLSHLPFLGTGDHTPNERYREFRLTEDEYWLLHGHTHSSQIWTPGVKQFHVGLDAWGLHPVSVYEATRLIYENEKEAA